MLKMLRALSADKSGATAIEYGLIVSLIVIAIIVSMSSVAEQSTNLWNTFSEKSADAMEGAST